MEENISTIIIEERFIIFLIMTISIVGGLLGALYREKIQKNNKDFTIQRLIILWLSSAFLSSVLTLFISIHVVKSPVIILVTSGIISFMGEEKILELLDRINFIKVILDILPSSFYQNKKTDINKIEKESDGDTQILIEYLKSVERIKLDFLNIYVPFRKFNGVNFYKGEIIDIGPGGIKIRNNNDIDLNINDKLKLLLHKVLDMEYFDEVTAKITYVDGDTLSLKFIETDENFDKNIRLWIIENTINYLNSKEGVEYE